MELNLNTLGFNGQLDGNLATITASKETVTVQVSVENDYAIVTKNGNVEKHHIQFQSRSGRLDYSIVSQLEAIANEKFAALQAMFNLKY